MLLLKYILTNENFGVYYNDLASNAIWTGWGEKEKIMYHYIADKEFLKQMKSLCSDIVNQLVQSINNVSMLTVEAHLVGSGARNLITQNANEPIDLDYNLCVLEVFGINSNDGKAIKEHVQEHFDFILKKFDLDNCQDSTSALSTNHIYFTNGNKTKFKIDLAIVRENRYGWERLIHRKTGIVAFDQWYWNEAPSSRGLTDRIRDIKRENLWPEVIDLYLEKKNMDLRRGEKNNHPSFNVYIETINEIHYKYFR